MEETIFYIHYVCTTIFHNSKVSVLESWNITLNIYVCVIKKLKGKPNA